MSSQDWNNRLFGQSFATKSNELDPIFPAQQKLNKGIQINVYDLVGGWSCQWTNVEFLLEFIRCVFVLLVFLGVIEYNVQLRLAWLSFFSQR